MKIPCKRITSHQVTGQQCKHKTPPPVLLPDTQSLSVSRKETLPRFPNSYYPLAGSSNIPFVCLLQEGRFYETAIKLPVRSRTSSKFIFARSSNFLA
ncbi:hypothetical protein NC653_025040 [Populus alba x Populus x berolinensis]|uniref:Uncharacterized protein n=1 Tax=Populus alba x Populus x berolinensis TaxID=444605 RepID=A0AAD6Q9G3_9ROSI|nr:hypothetical protein NC653_025040 [Populus alba x Populus x berolinensis]